MSGGYQKGGRSLFFAQQIGRGGKVSSTFEVLVEREVTLDEQLGNIESRVLRAITLLIHPGFDDVRVVRMEREDARKLRDLLDKAVQESRGLTEGGTR